VAAVYCKTGITGQNILPKEVRDRWHGRRRGVGATEDRYGLPKIIKADNGSESISREIDEWA
jgi:hypothetical protein